MQYESEYRFRQNGLKMEKVILLEVRTKIGGSTYTEIEARQRRARNQSRFSYGMYYSTARGSTNCTSLSKLG